MPIENIYPNSDVTSQWNVSTGASNYTEIDETEGNDDGDTTYNGNNDGANANNDYGTVVPSLTSATSINSFSIFHKGHLSMLMGLDIMEQPEPQVLHILNILMYGQQTQIRL